MNASFDLAWEETNMRSVEMTERIAEESPRLKARIAGGLWLLCIVTGVVSFTAGSSLMVRDNAAATAANILAKESLFRLGFAAELISGASYIGVTVFMYYVLKPVSRSLSLLAAFFGLVGVAIGGGAFLSRLAPLVLLRGDTYLSAFTTSQLQALALASLKLYVIGFSIGMVFFGIQCILIGYLIARSMFLPRVLGVLLSVGGLSYVIVSFTNFLLPMLGPRLTPFIMPLALIGEGSLTVWLLVKGVNEQRWEDQESPTEALRT
jgi:Domain of unknown function (DUF4386)